MSKLTKSQVKVVVMKATIGPIIFYVNRLPYVVVMRLRDFLAGPISWGNDPIEWFSEFMECLDNMGVPYESNRVLNRTLLINVDFDPRLPNWSFCCASRVEGRRNFMYGNLINRKPVVSKTIGNNDGADAGGSSVRGGNSFLRQDRFGTWSLA